MIWITLMGLVLAFTTYRLGAYVTVISIFSVVGQLAIIVVTLGIILWLVRHFVWGRRGRIRQIPRLGGD